MENRVSSQVQLVAGSSSWVPLELLNRRILVLAADHGGSDLHLSLSVFLSLSASLSRSLLLSPSISLSDLISLTLGLNSLSVSRSLDLSHISPSQCLCLSRCPGKKAKKKESEKKKEEE
jgi:hypothetical protein